jgi:osmoprotectant transport system substrate-binding protein
MRIHRTLALGATMLALVLGACTSGGGSTSPAASTAQSAAESMAESMVEHPSIKIGSVGFYESQLMAEIYAQALEQAGYPVERNLGIGTRDVTLPAIEDAQFDLMPEYIGSLLTKLGGSASGDPAATFSDLQTELNAVGITALDYAPAQDQNAFVVRQETADQYNLATMSDLAAVATQLVWGLPSECETNALCSGALEGSYGIPFADLNVEPYAACDAPIATALNDGVIDVAELCSTQPAIAQFNFVVLTDDMQTQPSENIAPIVRTEWLDAAPSDFASTLNAISAAMTTDELTALGVEVAVQQRDVAEVATEWLTDNGFL